MASNLPAVNVQMPESAMNKAMNVVFLAGAAGGTYLLVKKLVNDAQRNNALKDYANPSSTDGKATQYATQFYNAMYSTWEWFNSAFGDGTNEALVFQTAGDMHRHKVSLHTVAQKYRALYSLDLLTDLQRELSSDEMQQFNRMYSSGSLGATPAVQKRMVTATPAFVLNEKLQRIAFVRANTALGPMVDNFILPDNRILLGFMYHSALRYVDSAAVKLI
ncbi:hypothetical protein [Pontibacter pamirensis]|uniref:hypothetical protein n=1 Tax=Pontibacter pamirensis TaxID=2562824 RepID=UPI0013899DE2|nr:hypothetical protein [Pontibacter pamirensis]